MDASVRFVTRSRNFSTFLTDDAMILALPTAAASGSSETVRLRFVGANAGTMAGEESVAGGVHYLRGQDPAAWLIDVPTYSRIRRANLFPGIDLVYYGNGRRLEYDLHVSPGADPAAVVFTVEGGAGLSVATDGDLVIKTSSGDLRLAKPTVYQELDGVRMPVAGGYRIGPGREVRFSVGAFDATRTLVIDPVVLFSTYLGGTESDIPAAIAVDGAGNLYVTGTTQSVDFPLQGPLKSSPQNADLFITKIDPTGTRILYSTYLGGLRGDVATGIAVNASGQAYLLGYTQSPDFPLAQPLQTDLRSGQTVFVSKLSSDGSALLFSTYFGDAGISAGIALDAADGVWITGNGALGSTSQSFVAKLAVGPSGSALLLVTNLGGTASGLTRISSIDIDRNDGVYVAGHTSATDFPVLNPVQNTLAGIANDGFVTKYAVDRSYATLFGDTFDAENAGLPAPAYTLFGGWSVAQGAVDLEDAIQVIGPAATGLLVRAAVGGDARLESLQSLSLSPTASTVPVLNSNVYRLELDLAAPTGGGAGRVTVRIGSAFSEVFTVAATGSVTRVSRDFAVSTPTIAPVTIEWLAGETPAAVDRVQVSRVVEVPSLAYSTFLGGNGVDAITDIAVDANGQAHVAGYTNSAAFPVVAGLQGAIGGGSDAFVARLSATGSALLMSTFLGGTSDDGAFGIDVDTDGNSVVAGNTTSTDFPVLDALQATSGGINATFLAKIRGDGGLAYSTYLGGSDYEAIAGVAVDPNGSAYVAIQSTSTDRATVNPIQADNAGSNDVFLVKVSDAAQTQVFGLTQARGGNTGFASTTIRGVNLPGVIAVALVARGQSPVVATSIVTDSTGIRVTFDLRGVSIGARDVLVTFADGSTVTLQNAFQVEDGAGSSEAYRVLARPHFLGGWGLWDVQVGFRRRCVSAPSGW